MIDHFIVGFIFVYYLYLFHDNPARRVDDDTYHHKQKVKVVEQQDMGQFMAHAGTASESLFAGRDNNMIHPAEGSILTIMLYNPHPLTKSVATLPWKKHSILT